jgi:small subunit ribosomal protein S11
MTDTDFPTLDGVETEEKKEEKKVKKIRGRKKAYRHVTKGRAYIQSSYNNTILSFTDEQGNVIAFSSSGRCGFKGPKKATAYAAGIVVKDAAEKVAPYGLKEVDVYVKGIGSGRDAAVRSLNIQGIQINSIQDVTPIPHNGCRRPKRRRI